MSDTVTGMLLRQSARWVEQPFNSYGTADRAASRTSEKAERSILFPVPKPLTKKIQQRRLQHICIKVDFSTEKGCKDHLSKQGQSWSPKHKKRWWKGTRGTDQRKAKSKKEKAKKKNQMSVEADLSSAGSIMSGLLVAAMR